MTNTWVVQVELLVLRAHDQDDAVIQASRALDALPVDIAPGVRLGGLVGGGSDAYERG